MKKYLKDMIDRNNQGHLDDHDQIDLSYESEEGEEEIEESQSEIRLSSNHMMQ